MTQESCIRLESSGLQILRHHIYEYRKGVRNMILHTLKKREEQEAIRLLKSKKLNYLVMDVSEKKINLFFGDSDCIEIVKSFGFKPLNELSVEQDFILGIMLGYDRTNQFKRYLKRMPHKEIYSPLITSVM